MQPAEYVEVAYRTGGTAAARALAERRSGSPFDPTLVRVLCDHAAEIFDRLSDVGTWQTVIAAEPALTMVTAKPLWAKGDGRTIWDGCVVGGATRAVDLSH